MVGLWNRLAESKSDADSWASYLRQYVYPLSPTNLAQKINSLGMELSAVHDDTAIRACERLAAAHQSYLTDPAKIWFSYEPSTKLGELHKKSTKVKKWLRDCAEKTFQALAESNFYTVLHQAVLDRVGLGTGCFYGGISNTGKLMFIYVPFDSFRFEEDEYGMPNVLVRRMEMTASQALSWFGGEEKLSKEMRDSLSDPKECHIKKYTVYHYVGKATHPQKNDGKAYESIYVAEDGKHILEKGGFKEFPYAVTRFLKYAGPYGVAPGRLCWSSILNLQGARKAQRLLGNLKAYPRIKASAELVGRVSMKVGGVTVVKEGEQLPVEWATVGTYSELDKEISNERDIVKSSYYLDMLDLFGQHNRQMTATEVNARIEERLMAFSPTFCQHLYDFRPMMLRIFRLMYEARIFDVDNVPQELLQANIMGGVDFNADALPDIVYNSKFAQLMKQVHNQGLINSIQAIQAFGSIDPSVLARYDMDYGCSEIVRGYDAPEAFLVSDVEREQKLAEQAQQMQQQQMVEMAQQGGGVNPQLLEQAQSLGIM